MGRSICELFRSPDTRADSGPPATGRVDGDDSAWRFQPWKWLAAVAVAGGQTVWFAARSPDGALQGVAHFLVSLVGVYVAFAGATWFARRVGLFQYERPWVAVPALVASAAALAAPFVLGDSTGPFVAVYLGLLLVAGAIQRVLDEARTLVDR